MKNIFWIPLAIIIAAISCNTPKNIATANDPAVKNDTLRIANDELQYEVIIIDAGFNSWMAGNARPRNYYSQSYLEARNRAWVNEWNLRVNQPQRYGNMFEMPIDYQYGIDYGYEVNYLLYYYLTYFQLTNNVHLGGFSPRI